MKPSRIGLEPMSYMHAKAMASERSGGIIKTENRLPNHRKRLAKISIFDI